MQRIYLYKFFFIALIIAVVSACDGAKTPTQYYTWDGLEPDRWSSIWLMKRHIDTTANISIVPAGAQINKAVAIATPDSKVKRTHGYSNFENMVKAHNLQHDQALIRIGKIINELEISPWQLSTPAVSVVENQFRNLQFKYNRIDVPHACYAGFFDALYKKLKMDVKADNAYLNALNDALAPEKICSNLAQTIVSNDTVLVPEYPASYILKMIHADRKVIFVDTREDNEYDEFHIPGAVSLKLREVNSVSAKQFADADLVISYCVKDFRGYEVALALSKVGVKNTGIMKPYGLKGWKDLKLPVTSSKISEETAMKALKKRAANGV